jgi:hypothetical protein
MFKITNYDFEDFVLIEHEGIHIIFVMYFEHFVFGRQVFLCSTCKKKFLTQFSQPIIVKTLVDYKRLAFVLSRS